MNQVELHPFLSQIELVEYCKSEQIHLTAYSPLGTANHVKEVLQNPTIRDIATRNSMSPAQVLIRWSVERGIAVIPKTANLSRLKTNLDTQHYQLTQADMDALARLESSQRYVSGALWAMEGSPYTLDSLWSK